MSFQHTLQCITPDEEVEKWGSLSMQRTECYLQTAQAEAVKLAGFLLGCPKFCVCLLSFVSRFSPGSPVFCPSKFSMKFAVEQTSKNYHVSSPVIETIWDLPWGLQSLALTRGSCITACAVKAEFFRERQ